MTVRKAIEASRVVVQVSGARAKERFLQKIDDAIGDAAADGRTSVDIRIDEHNREHPNALSEYAKAELEKAGYEVEFVDPPSFGDIFPGCFMRIHWSDEV